MRTVTQKRPIVRMMFETLTRRTCPLDIVPMTGGNLRLSCIDIIEGWIKGEKKSDKRSIGNHAPSSAVKNSF
jgi:hypothetical protein